MSEVSFFNNMDFGFMYLRAKFFLVHYGLVSLIFTDVAIWI